MPVKPYDTSDSSQDSVYFFSLITLTILTMATMQRMRGSGCPCNPLTGYDHPWQVDRDIGLRDRFLLWLQSLLQ